MQFQEKTKFTKIIKIFSIISGIIAGFILCRIIIVTCHMPDNSMEPNIKKNDYLIFIKHVSPKPGDIVLMDSPTEPGRILIKRIVCSDGDSVEIKNKILLVNNKKFKFRWKTRSVDKRIFPMNFTYRDNMPVLKLSRNDFFVLSDDLDQCFDSRLFSLIRRESIIGTLIYIF